MKRVDEREWNLEKKRKREAGLHQPVPRVLHHPALAFYWNIKGEVDPQRHIVKPVTPITKALKWEEDGEEEQEEAENCVRGGVDGECEGGRGPAAATEDVKCVGDWEAAAGKVTVQQAIIISKPLLREVGEQDKWKGIVSTRGWGEGCWEPTMRDAEKPTEDVKNTGGFYWGPVIDS